VPGGYKYRDLALKVGGVSNLRQRNMVMSPAGLKPENDCAGEPSSNWKRQTHPLMREDESIPWINDLSESQYRILVGRRKEIDH
jgi:hypothetical protein